MKTIVFTTSIVFVSALLAVWLEGCTKYPDNRGISLIPPYNRILGKWVLARYLVNEVDSTSRFLQICGPIDCTFESVNFGNNSHRDNLFLRFYERKIAFPPAVSDSIIGGWFHLSDDKKQIKLTTFSDSLRFSFGPLIQAGNPRITIWKINKLTNKSMALTSMQFNKFYKIEFEKGK
jgi:hypothetical protein